MNLLISLAARLTVSAALIYGLHAFLVAHVMGDDRHDLPLLILCVTTGLAGLALLWRDLK